MSLSLWPYTGDDPFASAWDEAELGLVATQPHTEYQQDPIGWARDKLGIPEETIRWSLNEGYANHRWDGSEDPLVILMEAVRDWKHAGVEAGTGTNKSYTVSLLVLWFLACWEDSEVYTFAPVEKQLALYIWKHIGELWPRFKRHFPTAELTYLCIRMRGGINEKWSAHGYAVGVKADEQVSTRASGMHAAHMLLVYEEMPGQPQQVIEAGKNTCTAPHNLRVGIGNPNHQLDTLHKHCTSAGVVHIRISAHDHPNVVTGNANLIPGAVSQRSIDERLANYGETSPIYQSRVRGLSPAQASDALIWLEWLRASAARFEARRALGDLPTVVTGMGVDVAASENGDKGAICNFMGNTCPKFEAFPCPDPNKLGRRVAREMDESRDADPENPNRPDYGESLNPNNVGVDAVGVGAGTIGELRRLGKVVQALYAGGKPQKGVEKAPEGQRVEWRGDTNLFQNLRSQMYWQARIDLQTGQIDVEEDAELWEELIAPTFEDDNKVVKVLTKDDIRPLLGRSPDKADAFVMANWVRVRAVPKPGPRVLREGQSASYDYVKGGPREKESADQYVDRTFRAAAGDMLYRRGLQSRVPYNGGFRRP